MSQQEPTSEEQLQAQIEKLNLEGASIVLVRLGNDHYPLMDQETVDDAKKLIGDALRKVTNAPILFWNHAITIDSIRVPAMGSTPNNEPGPIVSITIPKRGQ